jgi:hypothetical protein
MDFSVEGTDMSLEEKRDKERLVLTKEWPALGFVKHVG